MFHRGFLRFAALMVVLYGCGGGGSATSPGVSTNSPGNAASPAGGNTVTLDPSNSFVPGTLNISLGVTVTWKWAVCSGDGYSACPMHSVTFDDGSNIASPVQDKGEFTRTFSLAGTYKYHCSIHGSGMSGQIVVK